jgi:hypothetical protein
MAYAVYPGRPGACIERPRRIRERTGESKTEMHRRIQEGRHPIFARIGPQAVGLPDYVTDDYIAAKLAGQDFDAIAYLKKVGGELISEPQ